MAHRLFPQPLWKLLVDMVSQRKFTPPIYVRDVITREIACYIFVNSGPEADCVVHRLQIHH